MKAERQGASGVGLPTLSKMAAPFAHHEATRLTQGAKSAGGDPEPAVRHRDDNALDVPPEKGSRQTHNLAEAGELTSHLPQPQQS